MHIRLAVGLGLLVAGMAAGCSPNPAGGGPSPAGPQPAAVSVPTQYSAPAASLHAAELTMAAGATRIVVRAGVTQASDLFEAGISGGGNPTLRVSSDRGRVGIETGAAGSGDTTVGIGLNPALSWRVRVSGGASALSLDLRALRLAGLEISGGAATMDVLLPRPQGTTPVRVGGGASALRFSAPSAVPVEVTIGGGVARATVDGETVESPAQGRRLDSSGYAGAADRYAIQLQAGAASFVLTRS